MRCRIKILSLILLSMAVLAGCGGGGSSAPAPSSSPDLTGQFVDSAVAGLKYVTSGGTEGVTDASGTFKYKAGETVTFYLGGILLGEATGAAILTPVSLVPGAMDESNATVANIARFLQTLDDDDNPDNGIQINADVVADTAGKVIDFTLNEADFDSATAAIITELTAMRAAGARTLLSAADAKLHLAGSLLCGRAGSYAGTYTGDADGDWSFVAEADGTITGSGKSTTFPDDPVFVIGGSVSSSGDSVVGSTTSGAEFSGTVELDGTVSGEWHNTDGSASGTYSGSRISGPSEPCSATGGGGTGFGFGSVAVSGDDTSVIDTAFTPNEVTAPDSVTLRWRHIIDGGGGAGVVTHSLQATFAADGSLLSFIYGQFIGTDEYDYFASCDVDDCSGVTIDDMAKTISFADAVVPARGTGLETAPVTLNGSLSYASTAIPGGGTDVSLVGTWKSPCHFNGSFNAIETITFIDAANATALSQRYSDAACSGAQVGTLNVKAVYMLGDVVTTSTHLSAKELDVMTTEIDGVPQTQPTYYDIAYISGSNLYFGLEDASHDASSPAQRLNTVDFTAAYVKQ